MTVSIDGDFARFGSKSYAINKINSVEVRVRKPHGIGGPILLSIFALVMAMASAGQFTKSDHQAIQSLLIAVALGGLAAWMFYRSSIREYQLFLMTSSSEAQAFTSRSEDEVANLRDEIEAAIAYHSRAAFGSRGVS